MKRELKLEELVVKLANRDAYEELSALEHPYLLLTIPDSCSLLQLQMRLYGMLGVPPEELLLIFSGTVFKDPKMKIPKECFEVDTVADEDMTIYRPRLILKIMRPVLETTDNVCDTTVHKAEPFLESSSFALSDDQADNEQNLSDVAASDAVRSPYLFDLAHELALINCSEHLSFLERHGFVDEGSFATLTPNNLCFKGVAWIPKRARQRILELASIIKKAMIRKDMEKSKQHQSLFSRHANTQSVSNSQRNLRETNKVMHMKNSNRATILKDKIDGIRSTMQCKREFMDPPKKTVASAHILKRLHLQGASEVPVAVASSMHSSEYCCDKHHRAVDMKKVSKLSLFTRQNRLFLDVLIMQLPSYSYGVASKEALFSIARKLMVKHELSFEKNEVDGIINASACDLLVQRRIVSSIQANEHSGDASRVSLLPIVWYDLSLFADKLSLYVELRSSKERS